MSGCIFAFSLLGCLLKLSVAINVDSTGIPISGEFVSFPVTHNVGMGHAFAEMNANMAASLHGLTIAYFCPIKDSTRHAINTTLLTTMLKWKVLSNFSLAQVESSVKKGYLRVRSFKTLSAQDIVKGTFVESNLKNVLYRSDKPINMGDYYNLTRRLWQKVLHVPPPSFQKTLNVAVHIRRGDVQNTPNRLHRYQPLSYFYSILYNLKIIFPNAEYHVFSEGAANDFLLLVRSFNIALHLGNDPLNDLLSMMASNILITSRSGFSHLAAELGHSIVLASRFWHTYNANPCVLFVNETDNLATRLLDILDRKKKGILL